jgi:DNA-binding winged helix-turn-helix (wHTH) protein
MNRDFKGVMRFECFELDLKGKELRRKGMRIPIQMQPLTLLIYLALHSGEIISRQTLHRRLWSLDTFVDFEAGLNFCVRQIRKALGEEVRNPRVLETLRGRGYRFLPPVELTRSAPLAVKGMEKIRITFHPPSALPDCGREMQQLAEEITHLVVASYRNSEPSPLFSSPRVNATGWVATHETTWSTEVHAIPGEEVQVRIRRDHGSDPRRGALRVG